MPSKSSATKMAYCLKCKAKKPLPANAEKKKTKNGRPMLVGPCPTCGTKMHLFVKA